MYESLVSADSPYSSFQLFSVSHIVVILITVGTLVCFYIWKEQLKAYSSFLKWGLVALLVGSEIYFNIWNLLIDEWSLQYTLPFQLCSISIYLSTFMLITKNHRLYEIVYFLGLAGATQAILTPELFYDFPHTRYFQFFIAHIAIILSPLYMTWIEGFRINFRSVIRAFFALNAVAVVVFFINLGFGANYMFLAKKPSNPSLLDFLGPYPWYILVLEGLAFVLFLLLYLPFHKRKATSRLIEID
ncbi:TIGR02206 family membrane protein [Bacillus carboniphilus]|uniref:TIGR02206 family membrane protein n=1 Tax=Bacillus carboniphilus TaxID=86663 RepID=A0ABN0W102_9BACI